MKYQVNMFYSLQVEAENEEQAEEKAGEYIASEEGQGVRLSDMSIEVELIGVPCEKCAICNENLYGPVQVHYHNEKCKKCGFMMVATQSHKCEGAAEDRDEGIVAAHKALDEFEAGARVKECDCEGTAEGRHEPECR